MNKVFVHTMSDFESQLPILLPQSQVSHLPYPQCTQAENAFVCQLKLLQQQQIKRLYLLLTCTICFAILCLLVL